METSEENNDCILYNINKHKWSMFYINCSWFIYVYIYLYTIGIYYCIMWFKSVKLYMAKFDKCVRFASPNQILRDPIRAKHNTYLYLTLPIILYYIITSRLMIIVFNSVIRSNHVRHQYTNIKYYTVRLHYI